MIDKKALDAELQEIRRARMEAQAAGGDLENLVDAMRHSGSGWRGIELYEAQPAQVRH